MNNLSYDDKVLLIKKMYKKNPIIMELCLIKYENYNIYICLNEIEKNNIYRLSWFDLDEIQDKNIEKYISCQHIHSDMINKVKEYCLGLDIENNYNDEFDDKNDIVIFNADVSTKNSNEINITFNKYLPISFAKLDEILVFIFRNMPKKFDVFLYEIMAKILGNTEKYEYKKEFDFDLFDGNLDSLFEKNIMERGKKYYEESKILFLEKIDNRYFAVVSGTYEYLVVIKYIEEDKKMQVYCSCPCEFYCKHIYSVLLAIRNNEFNRFYKVIYKNPNKDIMQRIAEFDYFLCLGVVEQNLEIINKFGEIEYVPILDSNNMCNWQVLEDSEDEILAKQINDYINNI